MNPHRRLDFRDAISSGEGRSEDVSELKVSERNLLRLAHFCLEGSCTYPQNLDNCTIFPS